MRRDILVVVASWVLVATGCGTAGPPADPNAAAAKARYEAGLTAFEAGDYDRAIDELNAARALSWTPLIDVALARSHDARKDTGQACLYWRSLETGGELGRLGAEGNQAAADAAKRARTRSEECWSEGLGLPLPVQGPMDAPVTILQVGEFQCPFCARVQPTLEKLLTTYPGQIRIAFLHRPLSFHRQAEPAARAAVAAQLQGKFWSFSRWAYKNQRNLTQDGFRAWAEEAGIDVAAFDNARRTAGPVVTRQDQVARSLGATGTPTFFINGKKLVGAQPFEKFDVEVREALVAAENADLKLTARQRHRQLASKHSQAYLDYVLDLKTPPANAAPPKPRPSGPKPVPSTVWRVPVHPDDATRGPADALVTLVMFADVQCPFCSRAHQTVEKMIKKYGKDLRVVFKHNPLPFHKQAKPAAYAMMAAGAQGKFWEMENRLFANQRKLHRPDLDAHAEALGLNMARFKKDMDAAETNGFSARIKRDQDLAAKVNARGTPNFFINGRNLRGAQPPARFESLIDEELAKARKMIKSGTKKAKLYEVIIQNGDEKRVFDQTSHRFDVRDRPVYGKADAPITFTVTMDVQCPYCAKIDSALRALVDRSGGRIRLLYKQFPLSFHKQAREGALWALAAWETAKKSSREREKFFKFLDAMYSNSRTLADGGIEKLARAAKLNVRAIKTQLNGKAIVARLEADMSECRAAGVRGTPSLYVQGRKYEPANRSAETMRADIDSFFDAKGKAKRK